MSLTRCGNRVHFVVVYGDEIAARFTQQVDERTTANRIVWKLDVNGGPGRKPWVGLPIGVTQIETRTRCAVFVTESTVASKNAPLAITGNP